MKHARLDYNRIQDPENKIGQDEPVFLLRAKDSLAPAMVESWASALRASGGDYKMVNMALEHAHKMREWQKENVFKLPDLPSNYADLVSRIGSNNAFKDRLIEEKDQLTEKLDKLNNFIAGDVFNSLAPIMRDLLVIQRDAMRTYLTCLVSRIRLLP